jgi:histone acetyltransferase (RNA polymerase elongator complex component)
MPVLWESKIVVADPEMPDMRKIVPMYDSHDPSLMKAWEKDRFTEDYIPEEVMAFVSDRYRNKPRAVTLRMGDRVSVLAKKRNNTKREVCLVRTSDDTYAWLYTFTLLDQAGNRMGKLE